MYMYLYMLTILTYYFAAFVFLISSCNNINISNYISKEIHTKSMKYINYYIRVHRHTP